MPLEFPSIEARTNRLPLTDWGALQRLAPNSPRLGDLINSQRLPQSVTPVARLMTLVTRSFPMLGIQEGDFVTAADRLMEKGMTPPKMDTTAWKKAALKPMPTGTGQLRDISGVNMVTTQRMNLLRKAGLGDGKVAATLLVQAAQEISTNFHAEYGETDMHIVSRAMPGASRDTHVEQAQRLVDYMRDIHDVASIARGDIQREPYSDWIDAMSVEVAACVKQRIIEGWEKQQAPLEDMLQQ